MHKAYALIGYASPKMRQIHEKKGGEAVLEFTQNLFPNTRIKCEKKYQQSLYIPLEEFQNQLLLSLHKYEWSFYRAV